MAIQERYQYANSINRKRMIEPIERSVDPETEFLRGDEYETPLVNFIDQYFKEIGQVDLLTRKEEVQLCRSIEKGRIAKVIIKNAQKLGILLNVNMPKNNLALITDKTAGILESSTLQYLEEFGLKKDDFTLVVKERTPKEDKENIILDDSSEYPENELETIVQDDDYVDPKDQSQIPEDDQKIILVKSIHIVNPENIQRTLDPQIIIRAIMEGENSRLHLIAANLKLVVSVAKKYPYMDSLLDLIQDGNIGLSIAADKFEWWKGFKFSTYSINWIKQTIDRGKKDKSHTIRIPVHAQEAMHLIEKTRRNLFDTNGSEPATEEIARILEWNPKKVDQIIRLTRIANGVTSIDEERVVDGETREDTLAATIPSTEPSPQDEAEKADLKERLLSAFKSSKLSEREMSVLTFRFGLLDDRQRTLEEVGNIFGITRERVRQLQEKALRKLRNPNTTRVLKEYKP